MTESIRDVAIKISTIVDQSGLQEAGKGVASIENALRSVGSAIVAAFAVERVASFVSNTISWADELSTVANRLGVSTDQLQQLRFMAERSDVSVEALQSGMSRLAVKIGEAASGSRASRQELMRLGVTLRDASGNVRPTQDVFADASEAISRMGSLAERTAAATRLLGRGGAELLPLMMRGKAGVAALVAEAAELGVVVGGDSVQALSDADDKLVRLRYTLTAVGAQIAVKILPFFEMFVNALQSVVTWFRNGENSMRVFTSFVGAGIATAIASLVLYTSAWTAAAAATWAAIWPVGLVVGAIALLGLAIDDLWTFAQGGDSLIEEVIGPEASAVLREIIDSVSFVANQLFPDLRGSAGDVGVYIRAVFLAIGDAVRFVATTLADLYRYFQANPLGDALADLKVIATDVFESIGGLVSDFLVDPFRTAVGLVSDVADAIGSITGIGSGPSVSPNVVGASAAAQAAAATQVNRTNTINGGAINIVVNGSGDPQTTATSVGRNVSREVDRQNRAALAIQGVR